MFKVRSEGHPLKRGELKVLAGTHKTKPVGFQGGEVGHDKPTFHKKVFLNVPHSKICKVMQYSGDLKSDLVWILNGSKEVGLQMVFN